jgi:hypothetical protein
MGTYNIFTSFHTKKTKIYNAQGRNIKKEKEKKTGGIGQKQMTWNK